MVMILKKSIIAGIAFAAFVFLFPMIYVPAAYATDIGANTTKYTWDGLNPYSQPFPTTLYYGSGDVNSDGSINTTDVSYLNEIIAGTKKSNIMADINGDGTFTSQDSILLMDSLQNGTTLPSNWNKLASTQQRIDWVMKMIKLDKTNEVPANPDYQYRCAHYAGQTAINFAFNRWDMHTTILSGGQTIYNIPMYIVVVSGVSPSHSINAVLVGENPLNYSDWLFIEPQSDEIVTPGSWSIPDGSLVDIQPVIQRAEIDMCGFDVLVSIRFIAKKAGSTFYNKIGNVLTARPVNTTSAIINCVDRWNPRIIGAGSGYLMYDQQRDDLSRTTDLRLTSLPYAASTVEQALTNDKYFSRLVDYCIDKNGIVNLLWQGQYVNSTDKVIHTGYYYGKIDTKTKAITEKTWICDNRKGTSKGKLICAQDGTILAFVYDRDKNCIRWMKKTSTGWSLPEIVVNSIYFTSPSYLDQRFNTNYAFDVVSTSDGRIQLAWIDTSFQKKNTVFLKEYSLAKGTWSAVSEAFKQENFDYTGKLRMQGISLAWDGKQTLCSFWIGPEDSKVSAEIFRGNLFLMTQTGTTWTVPTCFDSSTGNACAKVVSDGAGRSCIIWERRAGTFTKPVYSLRQSSDEVWETPTELGVIPGNSAYYPDAAFTQDGNLSMCWSSRNLETIQIETYKRTLSNTDAALSPPVLSYSFNDGSATDSSGYNNNGTLNGSTLPIKDTGIKYSGMYFNKNGYISAQNSSSLNFGTGDFSICFWIKTTASNMTILDKRNANGVGYHVKLYNGVPLLNICDPQTGYANYYNLSLLINDNNWHFVALTVDRDSSTGVCFNIDGALKAKMNATFNPGDLSNTANLLIGKNKDGTMDFVGSLDEVRLYNRVMSNTEIQNLYSNFYTKAIYSFDHHIGDVSGNGNSGDYLGTAFTSGISGAALSLDKSSKAIMIPSNPSQNLGKDNFTLSFWVKKSSVPTQQEIILEKMNYDTLNGYSFDISSQFLSFTVGPKNNGLLGYSVYFTPSSVYDNKWHHLAISVDRLNLKAYFYLDGKLLKQVSIAAFDWDISNLQPLSIGSDHKYGYKLNGSLDEVKLFDKALSATEITNLYNNKQ